MIMHLFGDATHAEAPVALLPPAPQKDAVDRTDEREQEVEQRQARTNPIFFQSHSQPGEERRVPGDWLLADFSRRLTMLRGMLRGESSPSHPLVQSLEVTRPLRYCRLTTAVH